MAIFEGPDWAPFLIQYFLFFLIGALVVIITLAILVVKFKGSHHSPGVERMAVLTEVSREGHLLSGDLVGFPDRTEDTGYLEHPDWRDGSGEQYHADVDIRGVVPARFLDADGKIKELWPFFNVDGQIVAGSFETMIKPFIANGNNGHSLNDDNLHSVAKDLVGTARTPDEAFTFLKANLRVNGVDAAHPLEPLPMNPRDAAPFFLASSAGRQGVGKLLRSGVFWATLIPAVLAAFLGGFLLHAFQVHLI